MKCIQSTLPLKRSVLMGVKNCFLWFYFLVLVKTDFLLFRCYEMEKRLKTPDLFKFPFFEAICWFVAKNLLETLKGKISSNLKNRVGMDTG